MLLSRTTCYLAGLLLLSGLTATVLAAESLKQQPPLELPTTLNDLELPASADNAKSDPVKKAVKSEATVKSEVKGVQLPPAKPLPQKDLGGLPEFGNYKTKPGDTVEKVLQKFYGSTPLRSDILRDALVQNNLKAFTKGNPKSLIPGSTLSLPDPLELAKKMLPPVTAGSPTEVVSVMAVNSSSFQVAPVATPAVPAGGGGAVAHSSGHNQPVQDGKRNWVRFP
jgi:Tfp pilus assembly protein FimV